MRLIDEIYSALYNLKRQHGDYPVCVKIGPEKFDQIRLECRHEEMPSNAMETIAGLPIEVVYDRGPDFLEYEYPNRA